VDDALQLHFDECKSGWISLHIEAKGQRLDLQLSHWLDPLPELIAWLEAISSGLARCGWTLCQEGCAVDFDVREQQLDDCMCRVSDPVNLVVHPNYSAPFLELTIERRELVRACYQAIREFATSERYLPDEWEYRTLGTLVRQKMGFDPHVWVATLLAAQLTRRALQMQFWLIEGGMASGTAPDDECIGTADEHAQMTNGAARSPDTYPCYWSHREWESLSEEAARQAYLMDCLNETSGSWSGLDWRQTRSVKLESWLAADGNWRAM
jgi:hypothetical protein